MNTTPELNATLTAVQAGEELPKMGEEYWMKAYHELSRLQLRTVEQNDSLRKENHKLRLALASYGASERYDN
jgi:hypothetical protein